MSITSVKNTILSKKSVINASIPVAPVISSYNILVAGVIVDDTAIDTLQTAVTQTIQINGTGFVSGAIITLGGSAVTTAYVSPNTLTFTAPAKSAATYPIYVLNPDGGTAIYIPGLPYSGTPVWTTAAGTLGSIYETNSISTAALATTGGDAPIVYTLASGALPAGSVLNASTGVITGTAPIEGSTTTYPFDIKATDAQLQDNLRSFSLTINTDVVTMANTSVTLDQNTASNTALTATSAAGKAVSYTSTALPAGLSIVGAAVTGTPTVAAVTATTFTATAATTNRTATATITWTVSVAADQYVMYNTLLLSGSASTETFVTDASTNNFALAIVNDTKPNNFNPYTPGYYSNYFDGAGDSLTTPTNAAFAFGTGDFTIEAWAYSLDISGTSQRCMFDTRSSSGSGAGLFLRENAATNGFILGIASSAVFTTSSGRVPNTWQHLAIVRISGIVYFYVNGALSTNTSFTTNLTDIYARISGFTDSIAAPYAYYGYLSNLRVVKGTAVYTGNFAVPTTPLTAVTNTSLLTCQSNRFIDNSTNAFTITVAGNTKVDPKTPFVPNTAYAAYGSTYFDGTGDYLSTPQNAAFNLGTGAFTVEAWVYITASNGANQRIIGLGDGANGGGPYTGWSFWIPNSLTQLSWYRYDGTETNLLVSYTFSVNTWYHVVAVRNGSSNLSLYVNGSRVYNNASATLSYNNVNSNPLYIGVTSDGSGGGYSTKYFNGYISNTRVVAGTAVYDPTVATLTVPSTPLTAVANTRLLTCQTNQPASNSMFLDSSTNALAITRAGNVSAGTFSPYGANWSNYLDGSGQAFYNSSFTGANFGTSNNFTIEMWVLWTASAASNQTVFELTGATRMIIGRSTTGIRLYNHITERGYTVTVPVGTWNHIAIVRNSGTISVYLNGVSGTSYADTYNWAHTQFYVGRNSDGVELTSAMYLSNLRVVNGTAVYNSNFAVPTAPLTAISGTTLLIGKSNGFVDNSTNAFPITSIGTPSVQRFSPFSPQTQTAITHSAYFAGSATDYITVTTGSSQLDLPGDFTVELWFYETATTKLLPQFARSSSSGFQCGVNAYDGGGNRKLDWRQSGAAPVYGVTAITTNVWHHAAYVKSGSTFRIFLDGVLEYYSGSYTTTFTSTLTYIGSANNGDATNYAFLGYISNFRVVKGTAVYTTASTTIGATIFAVPTAPLTAIANTALLTCQSATFVDNSTNALVITSAGAPKPRTINPFGFTSATAAYSAATYGASAYFDGSADTLSVPFTSAISLGTGNFTMEAWCYPTTTTNGVDSIWGSSNYSIMLYHSGTSWTLEVGDGGGNYFTIGGTAPIYAWNHMALTRSGSTFNLWINGVSAGTGTTAGTMKSGSTLFIGGNGNAQNFTGYMSNFRLVNGTAVYTSNFVPPVAPLTAITNTSLLLNMNSAGVYDSASGNNLETVADAKILATHTPYAGSYYSNYFDGTGDYLSVPSNAAFQLGTASYTFETWIYPTALGVVNTNNIINIGTYQTGLMIRVYGATTGIEIYTNNTQRLATSTGLTANTWQHIALVRNVSACTLYINGAVNGTFTDSSSISPATATLLIGMAGHNSSEFFTGYMSNYRLVKGTAVYTGSTFAVPTAPLTAIANTSLLTCQSNRFVDNSSNNFAITRYDNTSVQSFNPFQRNSGTTMYFDGTGDYLKAPYNPGLVFGTGDFTIECWLYQVAFVSDMVITASYASWAGSVNFYLGTRAGSPNILIFRAGDSIPITLNGNTAILANSWTHLAVSRASGVTRMFVNGVAQSATHTGSINIGTTAQSTGIGASNNASEPINGYINDLRITKGYARYPAALVPTTAFIAR